MVEIRFNNEELFERMHEALKGSRGYIDNEIILSKDATGHCLTIGYGEDPNLVIHMKAKDLSNEDSISCEYKTSKINDIPESCKHDDLADDPNWKYRMGFQE